MRFTRRLLDRRSPAVVIAVCCLSALTAASCSSSEDAPLAPSNSLDAGATPEASQATADAAVDASPGHDAAPFDGGPLPVVCTSPPCARSLVTTLPRTMPTPNAATEGFCALLEAGTVACWGANVEGQLGRGEEAGTDDSAIAARVAGLSNVVELDHTCARTAIGEVWCWGMGAYSTDEGDELTIKRSPVKIAIAPATSIGMGRFVGCAATDSGLLCWGDNSFNQIAPTGGGSFPPTTIDLPPGAPIRDLVIGDATFVLREDGTTLSWGANPPLARASSLTPNDPYPAPAALGAASSLDVTNTSGCATVGGIGYCWGAVDIFGYPTGSAPSPLINALPDPVVAPEPVVRIATTDTTTVASQTGARTVRPQRWCAIGASGDIYCWGGNSHGQAGDGTKDHAYQAVKVQGLPAPAAEVKTMPLSTCALLTTGKVYCWGNNFYGQLGNGVIKGGSLVPQEVVLP
jgi:Regulator of chromosome condensation (RCC1) repeat